MVRRCKCSNLLTNLTVQFRGRLSVIPGNARSVFNFDKKMRGHAGDVRVTGSAAHEMSSVGTGLYQFAIAVWRRFGTLRLRGSSFEKPAAR